jgi:hypothetical protein
MTLLPLRWDIRYSWRFMNRQIINRMDFLNSNNSYVAAMLEHSINVVKNNDTLDYSQLQVRTRQLNVI